MANANVGHIKCPISNQWAVVRTDKRGKLYYFSVAGKIAPNLPAGQRFLAEKADLWPDGEQPVNVTITEQFVGAPPIVTVNEMEKPLTPQAEERRAEKPLTPQVEPKPEKKRGFLSEFLTGGGLDD